MLRSFAEWLVETPLSHTIQGALWVIPTIQTVHILAIAAVLSSAVMISLRVFGLAGRAQTMQQVGRRFLPWLWCGFGVLAVSGCLLIVGEPKRSLLNPAFQAKMAMLAAAILMSLVFQHSVRINAIFWERAPARRRATQAAAVAAIILWCAIIVAGRWIAYIEVAP
jgi:uncharacterized membrane protein